MRRLVLTALLAVLALTAGTASASAATAPRPDPLAPPGATAHWLPAETWVMERWLPFDESALEQALGVGLADLDRTLRAGRPLTDLARQRGVSTRGLAARLVAARRPAPPAAKRAVLRGRAQRVLTQPHLAQHIIFHTFHTWSVVNHPQQAFGVSAADRDRALDQGRTLREIAASAGLAGDRVRRSVYALVGPLERRGVARGDVSKAESRVLRTRDRRFFESWLDYRSPTASGARASAASAGSAGHGPSLLCALPSDA